MAALGKIYKDRGDRWVIRLPHGVRIYCDKQRRTFYSKQHAQWCLSQIQGELAAGTFDSDFYAKRRKSLNSFSVYAAEWLKICERKTERGLMSRGYHRHVRQQVNDLFIPFFGERSVTEIKGRDIREFYFSLDNRSPKSMYNIMATLHKIFHDLVDDEVIQHIPNFPPDIRSTLEEPEWKWASEKTQELVFEQLDADSLFFILFQACHGTRTGETRALKHEDIDLENDVVRICRAFSEQDLRHTKTKRIRYLPLDPTWKEIYLSRPRAINPSQFVFSHNGKPRHTSWAWRKWKDACKRAGVAPITLYQATRHSLASQAANRGVSIYAIAKFLGHTNVKTTERYAHLETNSLRQVHRQARVRSLFAATCLQMEK